MFDKLNHVAIAVPDLEVAVSRYNRLGASISKPEDLPEHGVTVIFVELANTKIELLCPLGEDSPIAGFLKKNPAGGIHHLCFEVADILVAKAALIAEGVGILGNGEPKIGAHGNAVLFVHPKDFNGTLIEIEEILH
jgi:methylmalonyl-CoA/ethylmalonyl-CoA epimerase